MKMESTVYFRDWAPYWLKKQQPYIKESTYAAYTVAMTNHLLPSFGQYTLDKIDEDMVQEYTMFLLNNGRLDGRGGLAKKSAADIVTLLKVCLHAAAKQKLVTLQQMDILFPPEKKVQKLQVLSKEEHRRMIAAVRQETAPQALGILLCLNTGMRIGEICALQWKDIDFVQGVIVVYKTIQRIYMKDTAGSSSKITISTPKTRSSVREIPLVKELYLYLKSKMPENTEFYVVTGKKEYTEPRAYRYYYRRFLQKYGIEYIHFHALRHTFATRCIESGADYKSVSELLGHSTVNMTMNMYVHPQLERKRQCIEMLNASL